MDKLQTGSLSRKETRKLKAELEELQDQEDAAVKLVSAQRSQVTVTTPPTTAPAHPTPPTTAPQRLQQVVW